MVSPSSDSRLEMEAERTDWEIKRLEAALLMEPAFATSITYLI